MLQTRLKPGLLVRSDSIQKKITGPQARDLLTKVIAGAPDEALANEARRLKYEIYVEDVEAQ